MKTRVSVIVAILLGWVFVPSGFSQLSTPGLSAEEREKLYTSSIEKRADDILKALQMTDTAKAGQVRDIIVAQYRTLRSRDEAVDSLLRVVGKDVTYSNRAVF